jgi:bacterioferritin
MKPFSLNLAKIREQARSSIEDGAVTAGYQADRENVVKVLNDALATEIVCVLRYRFHYYMAGGLASEAVRAEFLEHANEEQEHADWLAERITQLNGKPELDPVKISQNSHTQYVEAEGILGMVTEDLVAERIAIETYTAILHWLGDRDPTTSRVVRKILEKEEEHAEDLATLLERTK